MSMNSAYPDHIRIATRQSQLALWQAEHVAGLLRAHYPEISVSLVPIVTQGDKVIDTPLTKIGGKGLFIKELEYALQEGRADIAVHSMKDVGAHLPAGFLLPTILKRENPFDAFVSNEFVHFKELPHGARVGTCSLRRRMQLAKLRPDLQLLDLRGNVQTRLAKLDAGSFDAVVLAAAGLIRLGLRERIRHCFTPQMCVPAIGQGAIGIECLARTELIEMLTPLNDLRTAQCVRAERIINEHLEGGCQVPLAAFARMEKGVCQFDARIGLPNGRRVVEFSRSGDLNEVKYMALEAVNALVAGGALSILHALQHS